MFEWPCTLTLNLVVFGFRVFVVFMCGVSVLWVPIIKSSSGGKLFTYMTAVEGYIAAPLGIVFLFSIFWTKTTEPVSLAKLYLKLLNEVLNLEEWILQHFFTLCSYLVNLFEQTIDLSILHFHVKKTQTNKRRGHLFFFKGGLLWINHCKYRRRNTSCSRICLPNAIMRWIWREASDSV